MSVPPSGHEHSSEPSARPLEPGDAGAVASILEVLEAALREKVLPNLVAEGIHRRLQWAGLLGDDSGTDSVAIVSQLRARVRQANQSHEPFARPRLAYGPQAIQAVTSESVAYLDEHGVQRTITLMECAGRGCYVAARHMMAPLFFVEFRSEPPVRFEFGDSEEAYEKLIDPLGSVGWPTFDLT